MHAHLQRNFTAPFRSCGSTKELRRKEKLQVRRRDEEASSSRKFSCNEVESRQREEVVAEPNVHQQMQG